MRNRFRPNVTPRACRRSSNASPTTAIPDSNEAEQPEEQLPFVPPNSSKGAGTEVTGEGEVLEVEVAETNAAEKVTEFEENSEKKTQDSNSATTSKPTRRSKIKPSIKPVTRKRNSSRITGKGAENTTQEAQDTAQEIQECTNIQETTATSIPDNTALRDTSNTNSTVGTPERSSITPIIEPTKELRSLTDQPEIPNENTTTAETAISSSEPRPPITGSLIARRKRATPKIHIASRRRPSNSAPKDGEEKVGNQPELAVSQEMQSDELTQDKDISESVESGEKTSKRARTTPADVLVDDIGVVEITVQADPISEPVEDKVVEEEEEIVIKKVGEKKRKAGKHRRLKEPLNPNKMTLQDLIYFNPKGNPMKASVDAKRKKLQIKTRGTSKSTDSEMGDVSMDVEEPEPNERPPTQSTTDPLATDPLATDPLATDPSVDGGADDTVCAPQVKIGADGCIILDEESLVIRSPTNSTLERSDIVYEDSSNLNFDGYIKSRRRSKWNMEETIKFYKALSQVGTDFSLMVPLFPKRQRKELKAKFKKEEKIRRELVDKALVHRSPISLEMFAKPVQTEEETIAEALAENENENDK